MNHIGVRMTRTEVRGDTESLSPILWTSKVRALTDLVPAVLASLELLAALFSGRDNRRDCALSKNWTENQNVGFESMNYAKKEQEKIRQFFEFYILF